MHNERAEHPLQHEGLEVGSHLPIANHSTEAGYVDDLPVLPELDEQNDKTK